MTFNKIKSIGADCICLDCEDGVAHTAKNQAWIILSSVHLNSIFLHRLHAWLKCSLKGALTGIFAYKNEKSLEKRTISANLPSTNEVPKYALKCKLHYPLQCDTFNADKYLDILNDN